MKKRFSVGGIATSAALVLVAAVSVLGGGAATPAFAAGPTGTAAFGTPTIDGTQDAVWDATQPVAFNTVGLDDVSSSPISAVTRFMWDNTNLYVLTTVTDDTPYSNDPDATGSELCHLNTFNDSVDVWVNWLNSPAASYDAPGDNGSPTATGVGVIRSGEAYENANPCDATTTDLSTIKTAVTSTAGGYTVEEAIPWPSGVRVGSPIGINVSVNDTSADDNTRTSWITWDTTHAYWDSPSNLPTVTPVGNESDGRIFSDVSDYNVPLGRTAYAPVWPKYMADSGVTYSADGNAVSVDPATGSITGVAVGTATVTAKKAGLADDQVTVHVIIPPGQPGFTTDAFTEPGGPEKAGTAVSDDVSRFWGNSTPTGFTKVGGDDWLSVSAAGVVTGTVPSPVPDHPGLIIVQGTDGTNTGTLTLTIPLVGHGDDHFLVPTLTTPATPVGGSVKQSVAGMWSGTTAPKFTKISGDNWLTVSTDGMVTGTAPKSATTGVITVNADDGLSAGTITVEVPVLARGQLPTITAASWNLWDDGSHVDNGLAKELAAITNSGLDVIGVQESDGKGAKALADALGWYSYQSSGDLGIVSAYPISNVTDPTSATPAAGVTVDVNGEDIRVWTAHLDEAPLGADANAEKATTRYAQATAIAKELAPDLAKAGKTPVLLLGDLASPSSADGGTVDWPVPDVFTTAGLTDSGATAPSPTYSLVDPAGATSRVDYVDYRGPLAVVAAGVYYTGWPSPTDTASNEWPSDHAAAVTEFRLLAPDTVAPVVTPRASGKAGSNGWFTSPVTITATATDNVTKKPLINYSADGGKTWKSYSDPIKIDNGSAGLLFRATDAAGNVSTVVPITVKIDSVAPRTTARIAMGRSSSLLTLTATDTGGSGVSTSQYELARGVWQTYRRPTAIALTSRPQTLSYRSIDKAGNIGAARTITIGAR